MSHHATVVSKRLTDAMEAIRGDFHGVSQNFKRLTEQRASFAPRFMTIFQQWKRETGRGFVAFVVALDPTVPANRAGYRKHPSYQAALYIQKEARRPSRSQPARTAFRVLASLMKSLQPVWHPHEAALFTAVVKASRWSDRDIARIERAVKSARAFPLPYVPQLVGRRVASVQEFPKRRAG